MSMSHYYAVMRLNFLFSEEHEFTKIQRESNQQMARDFYYGAWKATHPQGTKEDFDNRWQEIKFMY